MDERDARVDGGTGDRRCLVAERAMPAELLGELDSVEERWLKAHIADCPRCAAAYAAFTRLGQSLDRIAPGAATTRKPPSLAATLGVREAFHDTMETPIGPLLAAVSDEGLCAVSWIRDGGRELAIRDLEHRGYLATRDPVVVAPALAQLREYFSGTRKHFDLPLDLTGVSAFTRRALTGILDLGYGDVRTYGDVARLIGQPGATQAIGNAMGRNPIPVVVPCHRVIRADGTMGHYTGGADIKKALLALEGVTFERGDEQLALPL